MKIIAEFTDLEEVEIFAGFIKGKAAPETGQDMAAVPTAPPVAPTGAGTAAQQPFTGVRPPAPAVPAQQTAPAGGVPTAAPPMYTLDDLARATQPIYDSGRQAELKALLLNFGVEALPQLPQELYGAYAVALRNMGAQI